jgi:hypothetical protein
MHEQNGQLGLGLGLGPGLVPGLDPGLSPCLVMGPGLGLDLGLGPVLRYYCGRSVALTNEGVHLLGALPDPSGTTEL